MQDVATFALLSERGRAPSLHGVFTEGRIEGFIDGTNLKRRDLADPAKSATIARKVKKKKKKKKRRRRRRKKKEEW